MPLKLPSSHPRPPAYHPPASSTEPGWAFDWRKFHRTRRWRSCERVAIASGRQGERVRRFVAEKCVDNQAGCRVVARASAGGRAV